MRRAWPRLLAVAALTLAACAGGPDGISDDDGSAGDAGVPTDGSASADAPEVPCFALTFAAENDVALLAPVDLVAEVPDADLGTDGAIQWKVTRDGAGYPLESLSKRKIRIRAGEPGHYVVEATLVDSFESCTYQADSLDVLAKFRYRLTYSTQGGGIPPQDDTQSFTLVDGAVHPALPADYTLRGGVAVGGALIQDRFQATDEVLGAQLRLTPVAGGRPVTLYSSPTTGVYFGQVLNERQAILAVPYDARIAPFVAEHDADTLKTGFTVGPHAELSGEVRLDDPTGPLVGGAMVSVSTGGLIPALAVTGAEGTAAQGTFRISVPSVPSAQLRVEVSHPVIGRRGLVLAPATAGPSALGGPLTIVLDSTPVVEVRAKLASSSGAAARQAHVTFIAAGGGPGGQVVQDGVAYPALGSEIRVPAFSDDDGNVGPIQLPPASYQVVVEPATGVVGEALSLSTLDLSSGVAPTVPPVFATAKAVALEVRVMKMVGTVAEYVGQASVSLVAHGQLGVAQGATVSRAAPADDVPAPISFETSPVMAYDLVVDPPSNQHLPRMRFAATPSSQVVDLVLPPAREIRRRVLFPTGAPAAGVHVAVHCEGPACQDAGFLFAETLTDASGEFVLYVPDILELK